MFYYVLNGEFIDKCDIRSLVISSHEKLNTVVKYSTDLVIESKTEIQSHPPVEFSKLKDHFCKKTCFFELPADVSVIEEMTRQPMLFSHPFNVRCFPLTNLHSEFGDETAVAVLDDIDNDYGEYLEPVQTIDKIIRLIAGKNISIHTNPITKNIILYLDTNISFQKEYREIVYKVNDIVKDTSIVAEYIFDSGWKVSGSRHYDENGFRTFF